MHWQYAHLGSSGAGGQLNSNLLRSVLLTGVESGTGFDPWQPRCKDSTSPGEVGMFVLFPGLTWEGVYHEREPEA